MKKDTVILTALLLVLIIGGTFLVSPEKRTESKISTTYNADPMGVRAFYTLLQRMGYSTGRLKRPYTKMLRGAYVLIVVQPRSNADDTRFSQSITGHGISEGESEALMNWVKQGKTAIFLADNLDGIPASFGSTYKLGNGQIYAFPSRKKITNKGMRNTKNAVELLSIIDKHATKRNLILFDEYHHGIIESEPLTSRISRQAWIAIGIISVALILLVYSMGRRFGAVRSMPPSENVRVGYEFVESVARLYQRAHASDLAMGILCDSFKQGLCVKLGMSADAETDQISYRLSDNVGSGLAARASALLTRCDKAISAGEKPTGEELVDIAREVHELEKELGIGN